MQVSVQEVAVVSGAAIIANLFESFLGAALQGKAQWLSNDIVNAIQICLAASLALVTTKYIYVFMDPDPHEARQVMVLKFVHSAQTHGINKSVDLQICAVSFVLASTGSNACHLHSSSSLSLLVFASCSGDSGISDRKLQRSSRTAVKPASERQRWSLPRRTATILVLLGKYLSEITAHQSKLRFGLCGRWRCKPGFPLLLPGLSQC